ncbi:DUF1289 domain-containing protein [Shewanella sp. ENK2]|uniref:DUF1289 domain-containing protein n=1 Tax=Shewanella sp. ENK2 TaxID=2775245 RepID=UPI0037493A42
MATNMPFGQSKMANLKTNNIAENQQSTIVNSPCIGNCCLDEQDVCLGCHRRLDEILGWHKMTDNQKRELIQALSQRSTVPK